MNTTNANSWLNYDRSSPTSFEFNISCKNLYQRLQFIVICYYLFFKTYAAHCLNAITQEHKPYYYIIWTDRYVSRNVLSSSSIWYNSCRVRYISFTFLFNLYGFVRFWIRLYRSKIINIYKRTIKKTQWHPNVTERKTETNLTNIIRLVFIVWINLCFIKSLICYLICD